MIHFDTNHVIALIKCPGGLSMLKISQTLNDKYILEELLIQTGNVKACTAAHILVEKNNIQNCKN